MDEQGLAAQSANMQPRADGSGQGSGQQMEAMVEEVMKLLMKGDVTPEQLLQQGVPQEVIETAIARLQEIQARQASQAQPQAQPLP